MAKTIGFFNFQRKTGKSISTAYFAESLASFNLNVLVIDADKNLKLGKFLDVNNSLNSIETISKSENEFYYYAINTKELEKSIEFVVKNKESYDYILIDCDSYYSETTRMCLKIIDSVIIPLECEFYWSEGLEQTLKLVYNLEKLEILGFLISFVDSNNEKTKNIIQEIRGHFQSLVFESQIGRNYYLGLEKFTLESLNKTYSHFGLADYLGLANEILHKN